MRKLPWVISTKLATWDPDRHIDIKLNNAGPYRFKYSRTVNDVEEDEGCGFFLVEPDLGYSPEGICCQTYITKLMGPLSEWRQRLRVAKEAGYNMAHYTPIQQLGSSRSAYSISDHLRMDSTYFSSDHKPSKVEKTYTDYTGAKKKIAVDTSYVKMHSLVKGLHKEWGLLGLVDVVWNHTSFDTPWLKQHPEAGYNMTNSPHLRPAYALDAALRKFSSEIADGQWTQRGIRPEIENDWDVNCISARLLDSVLPQAQVWEYFSVDVESIVKEFRTAVYHLNGGSHPRPYGRRLSIIQDKEYRRLKSTVNMELVLELFNVDW